MDTFFLVILGFLALLAAIDLFVGVSNDASNFLNSAVGCRIAPYKVLVAVAGLGILFGATFSGGMMETYPAQFGEVTGITFLPDEFDDRCGLYLRVLGDLWEKDEGLNHTAEYISVDLTATSLTPAERSAVAWSFARSHKAQPMELSYEQLCQEGYISGLDEEDDFPAWEDGILFTIAETDDPEGEAEPPLGQDKGKDTVSFHADKWRSALGAYGLSQCVAVQNDDGLWGEYTVNGGAWIS